MSKRASKMRGYSSMLGRKVPYKVQYDNKKCSPVRPTQGEQMNIKVQSKDNRLSRRMQGER